MFRNCLKIVFLLPNCLAKKHPLEPIPPLEYATIVVAIVVLVLIGGLVAGLTIGLMSIDSTNLSILKVSGTASEKKYAERIEPIRKNGHLLLVTLLLVNTAVNESLPILFDSIRLTGFQAIISSTCLIVLFGEIIPQAVCSRYGLQIGAFFAIPVRILIMGLWIISYPIARLLDFLLGHKEGVIYRHAGLKELVALHGEDQAGPLSRDEVSILRAVLDLRSKTVKDVMTSINDVFMFSLSEKLDRATIQKILQAGHSRIPIYLGQDRNRIIGALLVKQLLLNDPDDETPLSSLKLRKLPRVCWDTPLFEMLHVFEAGASHMALVVDELSANTPLGNLDAMSTIAPPSPRWIARPENSNLKPLGIITLEDVIEELIGEEIVDETDQYVDISTKTKVNRLSQLSRIMSDNGQTQESENDNSEDGGETRPLLNPNSAIIYHPIKLPKSAFSKKYGEWNRKMKRGRKVLHHVDDLVSDLYSDASHSRGNSSAYYSPGFNDAKNEEPVDIPEIRLTVDGDPEDEEYSEYVAEA